MRGGASLVKATVREKEVEEKSEEEEEEEEEEQQQQQQESLPYLLVVPVRRPPISKRLTEGNR